MCYYMTDETVTVYDIELPKELYDELDDRVTKVDPSENYGKKHIVKQSCKIALYLLKDKYEEWDGDINRIKREMKDLEQVLS